MHDSPTPDDDLHARQDGAPTARRARSTPVRGGLQVALVMGLLALVATGAALAATVLADRGPLMAGARDGILVAWRHGDGFRMHLLDAGGTQIAEAGLASRGCPRLMGGMPAVVARGGFGHLDITPLGKGPTSSLDTSYGGGERWSRDGRAVALLNMDDGTATVVTLPAGPVAERSDRREAWKTWVAGDFSPDGSVVAEIVPDGRGGGSLAFIPAGGRRIVATIEGLSSTGDRGVVGSMAWSSDGTRLAAMIGGDLGGHVLVATVPTGPAPADAVRDLGAASPAGAAVGYVAGWSPDDRHLLVTSLVDAPAQQWWTVDAATGGWSALGTAPFTDPVGIAWSPDGTRVALLDGASIHLLTLGTTEVETVSLAGRAAAWSTDGQTLYVATDIGDRVAGGWQARDEVRLLAYRPWEGTGPRVVVTLPVDVPGVAAEDPTDALCVDVAPDALP